MLAERPFDRWRRSLLIGGLIGLGLALAGFDGAVLLALSGIGRLTWMRLLLGAIPLALGGIIIGVAMEIAARWQRAPLEGGAADTSGIIEFTTDQTGSRLRTNAKADAFLRGTSRPIELLTRLVSEDDEPSRLELLRLSGSARLGRPDQGEIRVRLGEAAPSILAIQVAPVNKRRMMALWSIADVTSERIMTTLAAKERAALDRMLDRLPAGLYSLDEKGQFLWANATFAGWLGVRPESLNGERRSFGEFVTSATGISFDPLVAMQNVELALTNAPVETSIGTPLRMSRILVNQAVEVEEDGAVWTASVAQKIVSAAATAQTGIAQPAMALRHFEQIFDIAPVGIAFLDRASRFTESNRALNELLADGDGALPGRDLFEFVSELDRTQLTERLAEIREGGASQRPLEIRLNGPREKTIALFASRLDRSGGDPAGLILHFIDLTDQKSLELQFSQAQKMQAIGQLAGGVAHDFNNLLTAMIGFCDLLLLRFRPGDQSFADIMQIKQNANRAANLVRQLLAFSRRQTLQPRVIDITEVLSELRHLLNRLLGEGIELELVHQRDLGPVKVDPGQLEQVIINLAVNARDAMPDGGTLAIRTVNVTLATALLQAAEAVPPGSYILIEVSDTGTGIDPEILVRIFEPFFSTKEVGSGTGLGLSTVYGIVKQTGGFIFVDSTLGTGTKFSIYLPRHLEVAASAAPKVLAAEAPRDLTGVGTILLVEDEAPVRMFSSRALRNKGYTVLEAKSGEAALDVIANTTETIDLVITDVVMPRMDGPTLIRHVREQLPHLKVIFISGYTEDALARRIADAENVSFLPKPFSLAQLAERVKEVLSRA